jgi:hypothetical protein
METKIPVPKVAVVARLRRKLAKQGVELWSRRGGRGWITVDQKSQKVSTDIFDLEKFAHELGALRTWEVLAADDEGAN